jgi:hypothetical protein
MRQQPCTLFPLLIFIACIQKQDVNEKIQQQQQATNVGGCKEAKQLGIVLFIAATWKKKQRKHVIAKSTVSFLRSCKYQTRLERN